MIREDTALIYTRLRASMDSFGRDFVEAHALDQATAKRIPSLTA